MNISFLLIICIVFFCKVFVYAGELEFSGDHTLYMSVPVTGEDTYDGNIKVPRLESDLAFTGIRGNYTLKTGLSIRTLLIESSQLDQMTEILPLENTLSLSGRRINSTLGFQYFSWGSADKINPTDKLNPRDYTTGPDADKIPVFAASFTLYPTDRLSFQGVYVPFRQPDRFPVNPADNIHEDLFLDGTRNVLFEDPSFDLSSFTAGARVRIMSGAFDLGLSYLYDTDEFYTPDVRLGTFPGVDAFALDTLVLKRERIHRIGLDFRTVIDRFGFWGETCYSLTGDNDNTSYDLRNHHMEWTLGTDFFYGESDEHYINIQHTGRFVINFDDSFYDDFPGGVPHLLSVYDPDIMEQYYYRLLTNRLGYQTEGLLLGGAIRNEYSFVNGRVLPSLEALYLYPFIYEEVTGKRYGDIIATAQIEFVPVDAVSIALGGQGFYSIMENDNGNIQNNSDNRIGYYFPESRIFLNATFSWAR